MTKKLINRVFSLILITAIIYTANHSYSCNIRNCIFCDLITVIGTCIGVGILIMLLIIYSNRDFDDFFEKYTDPYLKKFCDFLNRRNGGCNEKD